MSTIQEIIIQKFSSFAPPGMQAAANPFVSVLNIQTWQEFLLSNVYVGIFHYFNYLAIGGIFQLKFSIPHLSQPHSQESRKVGVHHEAAEDGYDRPFFFVTLHDNLDVESRKAPALLWILGRQIKLIWTSWTRETDFYLSVRFRHLVLPHPPFPAHRLVHEERPLPASRNDLSI